MALSALLRDWPFEPGVIAALAIIALLYWLGFRATQRDGGSAQRLRWWHGVFFALGILALLVALDSPLDTRGAHSLLEHMRGQVLLALVAPPLLLLGQPFRAFWRALPARARAGSLAWAIRHPVVYRTGRGAAGVLLQPWLGLLLATAMFWIALLPALLDAELTQSGTQALVNGLLLATALLFWAQVIVPAPLRSRLGYPARIVYVILNGMQASVGGAFFMFSPLPFYAYYVRHGIGASIAAALVDQHLAGAAMDMAGVTIFALAVTALLALWLIEDDREGKREAAALATARRG